MNMVNYCLDPILHQAIDIWDHQLIQQQQQQQMAQQPHPPQPPLVDIDSHDEDSDDEEEEDLEGFFLSTEQITTNRIPYGLIFEPKNSIFLKIVQTGFNKM